MRIAIIGSKAFDSLEYHLHDTLKVMGHDIFHIDLDDIIPVPLRYNQLFRLLSKKYDELIFNRLADKVVEASPELVIATYRFIHPLCIKKIKYNLKGAKIIHINPDTITTLDVQQIFASEYDAWCTKDPFMVNFMKNKMKLNTHYFPEALNPRIHKPYEGDRTENEKKVNIDVVSFGSMYPYRQRMLEHVINNGVNLSIFGVPNKRFFNPLIKENFRNEFITGERKAEIITGAKIVFNNFHYAEVESVNVKFFEINGIGGFQLCDYKKALEEYSPIDPEKYSFKTIDEAIEKMKYYLEKPNERYEIAKIQCEYFHKNHTYEIRLTELLNKI